MTDQKIKELETKKVKETKETEKKPAAKKKTAAKSSAKSATAKTKTSGKKAAPKKDAAPQKTTAEWITEFEALAKKNSGVLTYKEIQDRMQNTDSISVDEMDEIYSKLAEKNIEVVDDHAEEEEPENMDDEELTVGKDYLVKLGTRTIPGILKNIQYKIDVNTGEFIPVGRLRKNEIAVCDLVLQEEIVIDAFAKHKTLGELILIDRISNMTSACGVVENPTLDETKDLKCAFAHGNLKANGDIFEEYYYDLEAMNVFKVQPSDKTYTIGDVIPVKGETYQYPDSFDVVVLREQVAVSIRDQKVTAIIPLADFAYNDVPIINGRGFAVHVTSAADVDAFKKELSAEGSEISENFFNKWVDFETYRRIVFKDEHWTE